MPQPKKPADSRVQVMVEMGVAEGSTPDAILRIADRWATLGFRLDPGYPPVRIRPPREQRDRLAAAKIMVVIVRGLLDPKQIAAVEKQEQVRKVWLDTRLEPFAPPKPRGPKPRQRPTPPKLKGRRPGPPIPKPPRPKPPRPKPRPRRRPRPKVKIKPAGPLGFGSRPDCATTGKPIGFLDPDVVKFLGVDQIWASGCTGRGVVVGMVDAGITALGRPTKAGEVARIPNVVDGWPDNDWGTTAQGWGQHGNMTAHDVQGIAPDVQLWDIRIWQPPTAGGNPATEFAAWVSNALAGYRKAIDIHRTSGVPHILSNSWGLYNRNNGMDYATNPASPFALMVEEALDEGIHVLFAAGNCGSGCPFPANTLCGPGDRGPGNSILGPNGHPRVMTVGAANKNERWCGYTSQGAAVLPPNASKPDFCSITHFNGYFPTADPTIRDFDGGTSAATAVAAGVVALLKSKRAALTHDQAKTALMTTAKDIRAPGVDQDSGAGIIQALAAFNSV